MKERPGMESSSPESRLAITDAVLSRLPERLRAAVEWGLSRWPGRILERVTAGSIRMELFDRSMTIAAQLFTSVFPILIAIASLTSGSAKQVDDVIEMPPGTQQILDDALQSSSTTFGVVGLFIVLASATSLSRALTRAFAAIWGLPRPRSRLVFAWRWVAVVLALAVSLVAVRRLLQIADGLQPPDLWHVVVSVGCDLSVAVFVPWVLLGGVIRPRNLLCGAVLFGVVMLFVRPASGVFLPRALDESAQRYGAIGVAFTYLAYLYCLSFIFLTCSIFGEAVTTDEGRLGEWLRGGKPAVGEETPGTQRTKPVTADPLAATDPRLPKADLEQP
jgi:membrane protein